MLPKVQDKYLNWKNDTFKITHFVCPGLHVHRAPLFMEQLQVAGAAHRSCSYMSQTKQSQDHRTMESLRLEEASKHIESNHSLSSANSPLNHVLHQLNNIAKLPWVFFNVGSFALSFFQFCLCLLVCGCTAVSFFDCFCCVNSGEDLERNDGSTAKPYFMSASLHRILGKKKLSPKKAVG